MVTSIKWVMIIACISLSTMGCGLKYSVKGQVIDARTREPIEGAVAFIHWDRDSWSPIGCLGLPTSRVTIGTYEDTSDEKGEFHLPAHLQREYDFAIYKSGYVCFYNRQKFEKGKEGRITGRRFELNDGMVIPLEPLTEEYNKRRHAFFVEHTMITCNAPEKSAYGKATRPERRKRYDLKD